MVSSTSDIQLSTQFTGTKLILVGDRATCVCEQLSSGGGKGGSEGGRPPRAALYRGRHLRGEMRNFGVCIAMC